MSILVLIIQVAIIAFLLYYIYMLVYGMLKGAPYAPIRDIHLENMLTLLQVKKGEKALDIGAGDGRIVIALARKGAEAHGFEINPFLVLLGMWNIRRAGLQKNAHMHWKNFVRSDFSSFDVFTTYLTQFGMKQVEKKLEKEAKPTARIAVDYFQLPTWKASKKLDTIYLYEVKKNRVK